MKRAIIVGTSTLAGLGAVLALNPKELSSTGSSAPAGGAITTTADGSTNSGSGSSGSSGSGASGTYTGSAVQVRDFGIMQVEVTVADGQVTDITATQVPDWDSRSSMISSYAVPSLIDEAIQSQSASVSGVSGATFTSRGFAASLQSALAQAGLG